MKSLTWIPVILIFTLAGCKPPPPPPPPHIRVQPICAGGEMMMQTTLWFSLSRPQGAAVSATDWQRFLDKEVTPRFKHGFFVYEAQGQWTDSDGRLIKGNSRALLLIHDVEEDSHRQIEALRDIYKTRFSRASVMRVDAPACVGF